MLSVVVVMVLSTLTVHAATVLTVQDLNWGGGGEFFYRSVAAEFEQEHPGVKVEFINPYIFAGVNNLPADMPEGHIRSFLTAYRDAMHMGVAGGGIKP